MSVHIGAKKEEIAKVVLTCGDPLRVKVYAKKYLIRPKLVNEIRGMYAYTGVVKGTKSKITIIGHGMGLDSMGIYMYELYKFYDVETIIRLGTCGSYTKDLKLKDLVVVKESWTKSNYGLAFGFKQDTLHPTKTLLNTAKVVNVKEKYNAVFTKVNCSMWFYQTHELQPLKSYIDQGMLAVEMEAYALYAIAKKLNRKALAILTVSDNIATKKETSNSDRQNTFTKMANFAISILKELKYI